MCQLRVLARKGNSCIMECVDCRSIYLLFKEVSVTISPYDLKRMSDCLQQIEFDQYCVDMYDGVYRIVINTPNPDIHFNLNEKDFSHMKEALLESSCMQEVYALLD